MSSATVVLSPGFRKTFLKPFSSLTGRVTELNRSRMYICTTSLPARLPVFFTSTSSRVEPSRLIFFLDRRGFSIGEARVAQAEAEGIERRDVVEEIAAARRGLVVVEGRQMANRARNGDGQLAAGVDVAEERVGNRAAGLLAHVPALEDRRNALAERS